MKFFKDSKILATKQDLSEAKVDVIKWQVGNSNSNNWYFISTN